MSKQSIQSSHRISTIDKIIVSELANPSLTGEFISNRLGISRMQLHRILKSNHQMNATEYIRTKRMKRAKLLLLNNKISVTRVARKVGFRNLAYFSNTFKAQIGLSPSEYRASRF